MAIVEKSVLVHFSAHQMFDLVRAVPEYPNFLPWCAAGTIEKLEANLEKATVSMAFKGIKQSFSTLNQIIPNREIHMRLAEGPFKHLQGTWQFTELTTDACKVQFKLEYEFSSKVLEQLLGPVFSSVTNSFVDSFIRQAQALHGTGTNP